MRWRRCARFDGVRIRSLMVVAFDADVLILLLQPSIDPPTDPSTQRPVEYVSERLAQLVADLT